MRDKEKRTNRTCKYCKNNSELFKLAVQSSPNSEKKNVSISQRQKYALTHNPSGEPSPGSVL